MVINVQASSTIQWIAVLVLALPLVACDSASQKTQFVTTKSLNDKDDGTVKRTFSAALTPLEDIGLRKRQIPELLAQLAENPYFPPPKPFQCDGVKSEMADLDMLLGPDVDTPKATLSAKQQYAEAGGEMVQDAMVGLVRSQVNIIPFRSIVRRITGAESHEKAVARAIEGGKLRRAYLKGLSQAKFGDDCLPSPRIVANTPADPEKTAEGLEVSKK